MSKIKQITLTEREVEVLSLIQAQEGQRRMTDVIHDCILNYYKIQYFNKQYMNKQTRIKPLNVPEQELTDEQYCESVGGKIGNGKEGGTVCFVYKPGTQNGRGFPLSERKRIKECAKQFGII